MGELSRETIVWESSSNISGLSNCTKNPRTSLSRETLNLRNQIDSFTIKYFNLDYAQIIRIVRLEKRGRRILVLRLLSLPVDRSLYVQYTVLLDKRILVRIGINCIPYFISLCTKHKYAYEVFNHRSNECSKWKAVKVVEKDDGVMVCGPDGDDDHEEYEMEEYTCVVMKLMLSLKCGDETQRHKLFRIRCTVQGSF